jgi:ABC-type transporter Mla MlaB component
MIERDAKHAAIPASRRLQLAMTVGARDKIARRAALARGQDAGDGCGISRSAEVDYRVNDGTLHIQVEGPLDLRCLFRLICIGQAVDDSISECVLDLTGVDQIFDSGLAALLVLSKELTQRGVERIRIQGIELESPTLSPFLM